LTHKALEFASEPRLLAGVNALVPALPAMTCSVSPIASGRAARAGGWRLQLNAPTPHEDLDENLSSKSSD
jgi:hypothetical protein